MLHGHLRPHTQKGGRGGAQTAVIIPEVVPSPSFVFVPGQRLRRFEEEVEKEVQPSSNRVSAKQRTVSGGCAGRKQDGRRQHIRRCGDEPGGGVSI